MGLRNKMVLALLAVSLSSSAITGLLGFWCSRTALTVAAFDRMTALRAAKQGEVTRYFESVRDHVRFVSRRSSTLEAADRFVKGFDAMRDMPEDAAGMAAIREFYERIFMPEVSGTGEDWTSIEPFLPASSPARYLQKNYIVENTHPLFDKASLNDAGDGSEYSKAHQEFHPDFARMARDIGYHDVIFIHPDTHEIVYSVEKEIDLGASLQRDPLARTGLAKVVNQIDSSTGADEVFFVDFEFYVPSFGKPTMFLVSPVKDGDRLAAILVLQFSPDRLNRIMTGGRDVETGGLGRTGEVFLIGKDHRLRSESRFYIENAAKFSDDLLAAGWDRSVVDRMNLMRTSILTVPGNLDEVRRPSGNDDETAMIKSVLNRPSLASFAPMRIAGLDWAIEARLEENEALLSVREFLREALILQLAVLGITGLAALVVGGTMTRPILRLAQVVREFVNGFRDVRVRIDSGDEVEELATAFNVMATEIGTTENRLRRQITEKRKLLENYLPPNVFARFRNRKASDRLSSAPTETTLAFVEIEGMDQLFDDFDTEVAQNMNRKLIEAFDEAADRFGVEKLSSNGSGYLVACGMNHPFADQTQRILAFVQELECLVATFNAEYVTSLHLSSGVHQGPVGFGPSGKHDFVNDLWAKTVELATEIEPTFGRSAIRVSENVYERVAGHSEFRFEREDEKGADPAWTLLTKSAAN